VPVYAEDQLFAISENRAATADILPEDTQSVSINGQHSLATVFPLLG